MFNNPSLITRIAVGKVTGLIFGLIGLFMIPSILPETAGLVRWGFLLWYVTLGALIGLLGVFTRHPILNLPMPWYVRAPLLGAWMNFVLTFFAYDTLKAFMIAMFGEGSAFSSPFWFTVEGALFGLIAGYLATKAGGEGKEAVDT